MTLLLPLLMVLLIFACVATLYADGMWSNAVRLINVVMSALVATNFYETLARWLDEQQPSYTYFWDFLSLWLLFALTFGVLCELTNRISRVKVRFLKVADRIGSAFFALWIGWVMVCFTMMSLHTAPLSREFMFKGFKPEEQMIFGLAPDRQWLGFMQKVSMGAFSRSGTPDEIDKEKFVFDAKGEFLPKYATRRTQVQENVSQFDTLTVK